jgi:hypothetical protein
LLFIFSTKALLLHKNQSVMKFPHLKKRIIFFALATITIAKMDAQKKKTEINQDPIVDQLLNEKRKINNTLSITDQYKIQVFNGTSDLAKKTLTEFKSSNKNLDATIIFQTPNYKVWVGNFRNRMDAERNLIDIRKRYKTAFLIKPGK